MVLDLPWPPSVNSYYRSVPIGRQCRVLISKTGREYRKRVEAACVGVRPIEGRIDMRITARPPCRRKRDLDNILKSLLDAMEHAGVYENDNQIDRLLIERAEPTSGGMVQVSVEEIPVEGLLAVARRVP